MDVIQKITQQLGKRLAENTYSKSVHRLKYWQRCYAKTTRSERVKTVLDSIESCTNQDQVKACYRLTNLYQKCYGLTEQDIQAIYDALSKKRQELYVE